MIRFDITIHYQLASQPGRAEYKAARNYELFFSSLVITNADGDKDVWAPGTWESMSVAHRNYKMRLIDKTHNRKVCEDAGVNPEYLNYVFGLAD